MCHYKHLDAAPVSPPSVPLAPELLEECLGADARPGVDGQLHLGDLLVDLLHEVDYEVDELGNDA